MLNKPISKNRSIKGLTLDPWKEQDIPDDVKMFTPDNASQLTTAKTATGIKEQTIVWTVIPTAFRL